jgi:hypothetical protein
MYRKNGRDHGSMVWTILKAENHGYGVVVLNPNENVRAARYLNAVGVDVGPKGSYIDEQITYYTG